MSGRDTTEQLRSRVLAAWTASPARFREDANAEEDYALGGYRDRLVVELAQNAADAAARADRAGRLLLRHETGLLVAANTGAPLDAAGIESLASLRASAKRPDGEPGAGLVGRFGVGFAAVLAVTDTPRIVSRLADGSQVGVEFSRAATAEVVAGIPELAMELERRRGHVPVLRLPWWAGETDWRGVPDGYDTAVVLPLRDAGADALCRQLLEELDQALLLALPALDEIVVESHGRRRVLTARRHGSRVDIDDDGQAAQWWLARRSGILSLDVLRDRPTEERVRPSWEVCWAFALAGEPTLLGEEVTVVRPPTVPVLHAPTPTDEPLALPALLVATFPLEPSRRHVAPGSATDVLVAEAVQGYVVAVRELAAAGNEVSAAVPSPVPSGVLDARLRRGILDALRRVPVLSSASADHLVPPEDAAVVDGLGPVALTLVSHVVPGLVRSAWPRSALDALGVRRLRLADVVDELAGVLRDPAWWRTLYEALDSADPAELAALPVPLCDGRLVRGVRGALVVDRSSALRADDLTRLGLRVVAPDAAHPLLERLGAVPATPTRVLADPAVRDVADQAWDASDPEQIVDAVLGLVAAADGPAGEPLEVTWLGGIPLRADDGDLVRADELVLPDTPAADLLEDPPIVHPDLLRRWGAETLGRVGVASTLVLVRFEEVALEPGELADAGADVGVEDLGGWAEDVLAEVGNADVTGDLPPTIPELVAVRDLGLVRRDAWAAALQILSRPPLRDALVAPVRLRLPDGRSAQALPPAAWWIRRNATVDGHPLAALRLRGDDRLLGLYDEAALELDAEVLRAIGVRTTLEDLLAEPGGPDDLLERVLVTAVPATQLRAIYESLAGVDPRLVRVRDEVRLPHGAASAVVSADSVAVLDAPQHRQLPWRVRPVVVAGSVAQRLADVLDLPTTSDVVSATVETPGTERLTPEAVRLLVPDAPARWREHESLRVHVRSERLDGGPVLDVDWWMDDDGVHAATADGLAAGLAWAAGRWPARWAIAAVLTEPDRVGELIEDETFAH